MDNLEVFRMFLVYLVRFFLLVSLVVLHESPQHSYFLIHLTLKIKLIRFRQPQLAVIIIQALLRDADDLSSLLQVDFLFFVIGFRTGLMQIPPSLHEFQHLTDSPFFASFFLPIPAVQLEHRRVTVLLSCKFLPTAITYQNKLRIQQGPTDPSVLILDLADVDELVVMVRVDGDPMVFRVAIFGKDVVEVDILTVQVQLLLKKEGLVRVLTLYYEGFLLFRGGSGNL